MLISLVQVVIGLILLALCADWLVRGAVSIAVHLKVPKILIGLTIVALGTSAPELITSVRAVLVGQPGIVLGNAVGSNIANLALVLGIAGLMGAFSVQRRITWHDAPLMLGITAITFLLAFDGQVSTIDGVILVVCLIGLSLTALRRQQGDDDPLDEGDKPGSWKLAIALVLVGLAGLAFGAGMLVNGAVELAALLGISGTLVGATVVAFGTSAPELAATITAARQRHYGIMLGNLVGSCQLNLVAIVGIPALIAPLEVDRSMLSFHLPALLLITGTAWIMLYTRGLFQRREGAVALLLYLIYIATGILWRA